MTELEQLSNFIAFYNREKENVGYTGLDNWLKEYGQDFLNSLRNSNSSADNNKVEQSTTDEELMSKIEDILSCYQVDFNDNVIFTKDLFYQCHLDLFNLFKTHRNTFSTAVNQKDDNLLSQEDLLSKIESLALANCSGSFKWCSEISMSENEFSNFAKELIKLFTSCLNPVFRALNDLDEQSIIK